MSVGDFAVRAGAFIAFERLRALREEAGISQTALGDGSGITFQQVQKYENGVNRVSVSRLMQFCDD